MAEFITLPGLVRHIVGVVMYSLMLASIFMMQHDEIALVCQGQDPLLTLHLVVHLQDYSCSRNTSSKNGKTDTGKENFRTGYDVILDVRAL